MDMQVERAEGVSRIRISGEMNIYSSQLVKKRIMEEVYTAGAVELDLSMVSEMDTSGLQLLILASREARGSGKSLRITSPGEACGAVIRLFNLGGYLLLAEEGI